MGSYIVLCIVLLSHCRTRWLPLHEKLEEDRYTQRESQIKNWWIMMVYSKNAHKKRMRRTSKAKETLDIVHSNMCKPMTTALLCGERIWRQVLEKMSRQKTSKHWQRIKRELTSPYSQQNDVAERKYQTHWKFTRVDT